MTDQPQRQRRRGGELEAALLAAIAEYGKAHPVEIPDTGSLRGDMLALLGGRRAHERGDLLMTLKPVPAERLASIVDDLFLPLVAAYRGQD